MKKATTTKKGKQPEPVKPKPALVKIWFAEQKELDLLAEIKKLTKMNVSSKAIVEALQNYPNVVKRADGLNDELRKVNREYESMSNKFESVQRAFKIVMTVEEKPKSRTTYHDTGDIDKTIDHDYDDDDSCDECGNSDFFANGQCTECGHDKNG